MVCRLSGTEIARLGWLGLHVPERYGGAGFGLPELTIIVEQMGRAWLLDRSCRQ